MANKKHTNQLIHESSPYLRQHAHNPVDWYPWGDEAFERAKKEDKPILVSIGYSTCHWCHVMERESFEDERVAEFMNKYFINIKVDREERPDVDSIYMEAVQVISNGSGGWPLNCFLLPDGRPFFGGTYFPPRQAHGRTAWSKVLSNIANAFYSNRQEVDDQATKLMNYIQKTDGYFLSSFEESTDADLPFDANYLQDTYYGLRENFDRVEGGFGSTQKFPSVMSLRYLLNYAHLQNNQEAQEQLELSLDKMVMGGIFDQIGGGFARYTVDREWLVPHFEKMLYDNALLVGLLADACLVSKKTRYKEAIEQTLTWVKREMTNSEDGFYAALDADSDGEEGKYYVWQKAEIEEALGDEAEVFCAFYDISESGNWEGKNIPRRLQSYKAFAEQKGMSEADLKAQLTRNRQQLFELREQRVRPGLDDKSLLDWNALMITAYAKAYRALGKPEYKTTALKALVFVLTKHKQENGTHLYHSYKNGEAKHPAFFDDYALLIEALLEVYQITFDKNWLRKADEYTQLVINEFWDPEQQLFYFTAAEQTDIVLRKKSLYDSATPSGNSTMVLNLQKLAIALDKSAYAEQAMQMLLTLQDSIKKYPQSFSRWANAVIPMVHTYKEIAVVGDDYDKVTKEIYQHFIPNAFLMASPQADDSLPLLTGRETGDKTLIFVCSNYACQLPNETVEDMLEQL